MADVGEPEDGLLWWVETDSYIYSEYEDLYLVAQYNVTDLVEVYAPNKTAAKSLGVKHMLEPKTYHQYCKEKKADGLSPYGGITVTLAVCGHGVTFDENWDCQSCHMEYDDWEAQAFKKCKRVSNAI